MEASHRIVLSVLSPRLNDSNAYVPKAESNSIRRYPPPHSPEANIGGGQKHYLKPASALVSDS